MAQRFTNIVLLSTILFSLSFTNVWAGKKDLLILKKDSKVLKGKVVELTPEGVRFKMKAATIFFKSEEIAPQNLFELHLVKQMATKLRTLVCLRSNYNLEGTINRSQDSRMNKWYETFASETMSGAYLKPLPHCDYLKEISFLQYSGNFSDPDFIQKG